jgi:hypothetical protein
MKIFITLLLISCLFSCKKEEDVIECETPAADSIETQQILKIEIGHDSYQDLIIQINSEEKKGDIFTVETGDSVYVQVINNCWTAYHSGLGDTIATPYLECDDNHIKVFLNDVYVEGDECSPTPSPLHGCPTNYTANYIVE